jgi:hypothetical protein
MPRRSGIEKSQFADDTAAYTSKKNISYAVNNLQRYTSHPESWLYKRKIKINTGKNTAVIFTKRGRPRRPATS